jgi:hypothetical protein
MNAIAPPPPTRPVDPTRAWLDTAPLASGVRPIDRIPPPEAGATRPTFRRQGAPGMPDASAPGQAVISLVRDAGVLRWRMGPIAGLGSQQRAGWRAALPACEVVKQYAFEALDTSQVYTALAGLDRSLTPSAVYSSSPAGVSGLREFKDGTLVPFQPSAAAGKKVLLFIHGTFSNSEALLSEGLPTTAPGRDLLAAAKAKYDRLLCFDHATLGVSPMLNAFDLAALLRASPASVDIVCHSRGGLVARWFCEGFAPEQLARRVVFVGSPLAGTSLAAASRLRASIDLLTNVADALRAAGDLAGANPLFLAASGLLRVFSAITGVLANTPVMDAAIALVPGLDAQSRTGNCEELRRLRTNTGTADFSSAPIQYFAVKSNFEPQAIGWDFLRVFSKPMQRIADSAADYVFDGPNDLVVDTTSMAEVADGRTVSIAHDFGTSPTVHHTNYFVQPETAKAIRDSLRF